MDEFAYGSAILVLTKNYQVTFSIPFDNALAMAIGFYAQRS